MEGALPIEDADADQFSTWLLKDDALIETFCPLDQSRIWDLNAAYWARRGAAAFDEDGVPYLATSDGTLSSATAKMLHAADIAGTPFDAIVEFGPGLGLFARLTARRLTEAGTQLPAYLGVDVSPTLLACAEARLADAPFASVQTRVLDLARNAADLPDLLRTAMPDCQRILCIFNYVLDSLPVKQVRLKDGVFEQREIELRHCGAPKSDCVPNTDLIMRTRWGAVTSTPRIDVPEGSAKTLAVGALDVLEKLHGYPPVQAVLLNDYPVGQRDHVAEPFERFGGSVAAGLDFDDLEADLGKDWSVTAPSGDDSQRITSRLLCRDADTVDADAFSTHFRFEDANEAHQLSASARQLLQQGSRAAAMSAYVRALDAEPESWSLKLEVAGFLAGQMERWADAQKLVALVLDDNPFSTDALKLAGDCSMSQDQFADGLQNFRAGLDLAPLNAELWLKSAQANLALDKPADAMSAISQGLSAQGSEATADRLLNLQREAAWHQRQTHG